MSCVFIVPQVAAALLYAFDWRDVGSHFSQGHTLPGPAHVLTAWLRHDFAASTALPAPNLPVG